MADYSQMIAIPRNEYTQLTTVQNARQPLTQQFYKLESDYQSNALIPNAHQSISLQAETIEKMKNLKDQMRHYLTVSTPKPYRSRAESLFQSLEPYLNVNDIGEIIKDDGSVIKSSRFEDLVQHAVRDRRRQFSPTGWDYFISLLKKYNVPRASLNRDTLEELQMPSIKTAKPSKLPQPSKIPNPFKKLTDKLVTLPSKKSETMSDYRAKQRKGRTYVRTRTPSKRAKAPPKRFMFEYY